MIVPVRLLPIAALTVLLAACGGAGYSTPATSAAPGSAGTTLPASSAGSPLSFARGSSQDVDAFAGTTPYSYGITSSNTACANGAPGTAQNAGGYGVTVTIPAAAAVGCSATLSVGFTVLGTATPVLTDVIYVFVGA